MHTFKKVRDGDGYIWTVGHYTLQGYEDFSSDHLWIAMKDFNTEAEAMAWVSYLNGGEHPLRHVQYWS